jgi:hypothetical protein
VWWSPSPRTPWQQFGDDDRAALKDEFEAAGRGSALDLFGAAEPA